MEALTEAYRASDGDALSRAIRQVEGVISYDGTLSGIADSLKDAESILSDLSRSISDYMETMDFS